MADEVVHEEPEPVGERPEASVLNVPIETKAELPNGAKRFVSRLEKAGWVWDAAYSCVWIYRAGQRRCYVEYDSVVVAGRPAGRRSHVNHISACWDAEVLDAGDESKQDWKGRYKLLNPKLYPFITINDKDVTSLLALAAPEEGPWHKTTEISPTG